MSNDNEHDVLVIGGGPAGSVAATALARSGLRVRLIESARFPRYHIGESLTPSCRAITDAIGISEKLDSHGFVLKYGGAFRWESDAWFFDWGAMLGIAAWQVDRAEFDQVLLDHAMASGVDVSTGVTAKDVSFENGRPVSVTCLPDDGEPFTIEGFGHLIDASGRAGLLSARHFRTRRVEPTLRNIAIWGYWGPTAVLPATPGGGINIISSPTGWYWIIPLAGGRTSIGFVTRKDHFAVRRPAFDSVDAMYQALIEESATVRGLVGDVEFLGPVRVEADYSYSAERFCGPGHLIVGDAACFLDPLLSTGVQLALYSGLTAAACVASVHRGEVTEQAAHGFFEYAYRRAYARLFALVSVMYERYLGKDGFFSVSDRLVGAAPGEHDGAPDEASSSFVEIISGLADLREAGDAQTRVLTKQLITEALEVQERVIGASDGPGQPDFTSVLDSPLLDAESADYRLVTSPRLGLEPTRGAEPSS